MTGLDDDRPGQGRRAGGLALLGLLALGCGRGADDALAIASPWPADERRAIADDYRATRPEARPIAWVALAPGDDAARVVPALGVDLALGLDSADLDRLAAAGHLERFDDGEARRWRVARRSTLGVAENRDFGVAGPSLADRSFAGLVALDDPRRDPLSLAWAKDRLATGGYGGLVRTAANARRVGRGGTAGAIVREGRAAAAPASGTVGPIDERTSLVRSPDAPPRLEGVGIVAGTPHHEEAKAFLAFLADRGQAVPVPPGATTADPVVDDLLLDLLGATLVDARDELVQAADALDRAGRPPLLDRYLDDPPPWPPTSIVALREGPEGADLLETLAREICPDREARARLVLAWDAPRRPVDLAWIRETASLVDGRLAREPRFRAWLRGEWTAWARQHYRRIAREAARGEAEGEGGG